MLHVVAIARIAWIESCQMTGEYVSKKSTPCFWIKPLATRQAYISQFGRWHEI
jgi:hypothetical protein